MVDEGAFGAEPQEDEEEEEEEEEERQQQSRSGPDASVVLPWNAAPVVGVPHYPSCIKWSEENLLAVGAGHVITILDPASMSGPRGFVPVTASPGFDFGRVQPQDLRAYSLFQLCLARDPRPEVRCIDWSPPGLAQNGGSLLAICTTDSRVKLYRAPFCDFQSEWVEINDLTEMVFNYCRKNDFREAKLAAEGLSSEEEAIPPPFKWGPMPKKKRSDSGKPHHRKVKKTRLNVTDSVAEGAGLALAPPAAGIPSMVDIHTLHDPLVLVDDDRGSAAIGKNSRVEVLEDEDDLRYWVGGYVVQILNGQALVNLDRPQHGQTEQWVPIHGQSAVIDNLELAERIKRPYPTNSPIEKDGVKILPFQRPRIRPLLILDTLKKCLTDAAGGKRSLIDGELVEAWINERWQEGKVVGTHGSDVTVRFSSLSVVLDQDKLRLPPLWDEERGMWKVNGPDPNSRDGVDGRNITVARQWATETGVGLPMPIDSGVTFHSDHTEDRTQSQDNATFSPQAANSLFLDTDQGEVPPLLLCGVEKSASDDLNSDSMENSYSKVYKRRGLVNPTPLAVRVPISNTLATEAVTTRPVRDKRLPTKLRNDEPLLWSKSADDAGYDENVLQDNLNNEAVKKGRGGKVKHVRFAKETGKSEQGSSVKDADVLESTVGKPSRLDEPYKETTSSQQRISAPEFAARSELLSPVALAWSSKYDVQVLHDPVKGENVENLVLLGAGMKSGRVSLWQMAFPTSYSIDSGHVPAAASFLGFLNAHESWVTCLSWAKCSKFYLGKVKASTFCDNAEPTGETLLLATGCVDGSVKLWAAVTKELHISQFTNDSVPFMCLSQVAKVDRVPVTALLLFVPPRASTRALLAVGKGSGSVAVWELKSSGDFRLLYSQDLAHQQMVTGFSWTSDGRCLYSCGQDSLKCWDFSHDQLLPLRFPDGSAVSPSVTASDVCGLETLESFYGLSLSPNGLALATVRGVFSDMLDQMYQARLQKGLVQLFWLGNEHMDIKKVEDGDKFRSVAGSLQAMSEAEKACWALNVIHALEELQDPGRFLVLWEVVATLLSLKQKIGVEGVVSILRSWLVRSGSIQEEVAVEAFSSHESSTEVFEKAISKASCRQLQILNVIYRKIFLTNVKSNIWSAHGVKGIRHMNDALEAKVWRYRLRLMEDDLRQRLVHMRLKNASALRDDKLEDSAQENKSEEVQLLTEWVLCNVSSVGTPLVEIATHLHQKKRNQFGIVATPIPETCYLCDSTVPFDSPEAAVCSGSASKHHLQRCSVSMRVCPPVPLWHCSCCGRSSTKQAPALFSSLSGEQIAGLTFPVRNDGDGFPCCPFCGILMGRLLPDFFLTPSLV